MEQMLTRRALKLWWRFNTQENKEGRLLKRVSDYSASQSHSGQSENQIKSCSLAESWVRQKWIDSESESRSVMSDSCNHTNCIPLGFSVCGVSQARILEWVFICFSWLRSSDTYIRKDPDARKDWRWEEKGMTESEMVGWYHQLNGHKFE